MAHQLSPKHQDLIERNIKITDYSDADQVIEEALRRMEEREERLTELRAAIAIGDAAIARGDVVDWTPDFFEQLDREVAEAEQSEQPVGNDVWP